MALVTIDCDGLCIICPSEHADTARAMVAAASEVEGVIQAREMVRLVRDPRMHTATTLGRALASIGARYEV